LYNLISFLKEIFSNFNPLGRRGYCNYGFDTYWNSCSLLL